MRPLAEFHLALMLVQIIAILAVARAAGLLLRRIGQPQVIGEMVAGILLGPSLFGALWPAGYAGLFPPGSLGFLRSLSQVGIIFFMFLVGLELDVRHLRERSRTAVLTSNVSIILPFGLGALLAMGLHAQYAPPGVPVLHFALFVAAAMSITAFPVLARILADQGLAGTRLGALALACAAVDDVSAWCILAAVVVLVRGSDGGLPVWATALGLVAWIVLMLTVGRVLLRRLTQARGPAADVVVVVVLTALASAWVTEVLGVHALFGAFLAGVAMPRDARFVGGILGRFEDVMVTLFLPLFFALSGIRTSILLIQGSMWGVFALLLLVAVAGKLGGSALAARTTGLPWRESVALGILMNTRGLMELIILNVGLDLGVISPALFAMLVLMALVTTFMTSPLLARLDLTRVRPEPRPLASAA